MSELYCYVVNDVITKPPAKAIWVGGAEVTRNPFKRPNMIGPVRIGPAVSDDELAALRVFGIVVTEDPKPGEFYVLVEGTPTVSGLRVIRQDTWRAMTTEEQALYEQQQATAEFIDQVEAALDRLIVIENNVVGSTSAQTQQAVRDIAKYLRHTIRKVLEQEL